ncbi:hypothetical protein PBV52_40795 [Streptomyces sp. T12]|uniref:hypothetical protein n=2 Tax=unclassified Streptomyces TaxID=2593676 RepID=UPI0023657255|nr:hypothetical protein [Streptomyces sp. T12]WDF42696.1 hypothetical protein PBV52_40795 [Streptomyces sp. T12]
MRHPPRSVLLAVTGTVALIAAVTVPALHVSGNKLVDADGTTRRLLGVHRSGGEFMTGWPE